MTTTQTASERIVEEATAWDGVTAVPGSRGELSLRLDRRELGHLHGDRVLHIAFPKEVWHRLHDAGRLDYHPVFRGKPGYGSRALTGTGDVEDAIAMLRMNYERAIERHGLPGDD
jgi:hypothetical protein